MRELPEGVEPPPPPPPPPDGEVGVMPLTAPTGVVATKVGTDRIRVAWAAVPYAAAIEVWEAATTAAPVATLAGTATERTSGALAADGRSYTYRVRAVSSTGAVSAFGYADTIILTGTPGTGEPVTGIPVSTGIRPTTANTGVTGTLTPAGVHTPTSGQVYEDLDINPSGGVLVLDGKAGITYRNCLIRGRVDTRLSTGIVFEDCTSGAWNLSSSQNVQLVRCHSTGITGYDGFHVTSDRPTTGSRVRAADIVLVDCLATDPKVHDVHHYDGIQVRGVDRLLLRNCAFDLGETFWAGFFNAAIYIETDYERGNGTNYDVLIDGCWTKTPAWTHMQLQGYRVEIRNHRFSAYLKGRSEPVRDETSWNNVVNGGNNLFDDGSIASPLNGTITAPADPAAPAPAPTPTTGQPTNANTGVPAGTTLTAFDGSYGASNVVITDRVFTAGDKLFTGSNVTLRRCRIPDLVRFTGDNVTLEDCDAGSVAFSGVMGFTVRRHRSTGRPGSDALTVTSDTGQAGNGLVEDSYLGNAVLTVGSHFDPIQVRGVAGLTLRRVFFDQGATFDERYAYAVFLQNANGGNSNVTVEDCWVRAAGYFALNINGTGVSITGTTFYPLPSQSDWQYPTGQSVFVESGNQLLDGTPITIQGA